MRSSIKILKKTLDCLLDLQNSYPVKVSKKHEQQHREMKRHIDWNQLNDTIDNLRLTLSNINGGKK